MRCFELWTLGAYADEAPVSVDRERTRPCDPRAPDCQRLGCKVLENGAVEHVRLDRKADAS